MEKPLKSADFLKEKSLDIPTFFHILPYSDPTQQETPIALNYQSGTAESAHIHPYYGCRLPDNNILLLSKF